MALQRHAHLTDRLPDGRALHRGSCRACRDLVRRGRGRGPAGQRLSVDEYGDLPELNELDALKPRRSATFTAVGYGLQKSFPDAASWKTVAQRVRMVAQPHLVQINGGIVGDFSLHLSNNANTGGTCFGDSGGPNFLGNSNVVAGVTSFGLNGSCAGTGGVYRVDRADDLNWVGTFLD